MTDIAKKQYVLSSCPLPLEDMQEHRLIGKYLYTNPELNMSVWHTANGTQVVLLGNAFCTDKAGKHPREDIAAFAGEDIADATRYWTGRWTLLTEQVLVNDASGLMGAYYMQQESGWVVTSSPALLARVTGKNALGAVKAEGISWQIVPGCIVEGCKTLLCTQHLCFTETKIYTAPSHWIRDYRHLSTQEKCQTVANMLVNGLKNIHIFSGREILLALTGGKDSRVTLGALLKAGVPFTAYTAQHSNISSSDVDIPPKIAKAFGISHCYISRGKWDKKKEEDYVNFTAGNSRGADTAFYARGQFEKLPKNALMIRSGLYEAGQTYGRTIAMQETFADDIKAYYKDISRIPEQNTAFEAWLKSVEENPVSFLDIRDRFYIEQRVGGWVAAIEQSLDLNDFVSIQIANCAELLSVLLSCNEQERKELALSYGIIKLLEPKLLAFPVNKATIRDKMKRICSVLRNPVTKLRNYFNQK